MSYKLSELTHKKYTIHCTTEAQWKDVAKLTGCYQSYPNLSDQYIDLDDKYVRRGFTKPESTLYNIIEAADFVRDNQVCDLKVGDRVRCMPGYYNSTGDLSKYMGAGYKENLEFTIKSLSNGIAWGDPAEFGVYIQCLVYASDHKYEDVSSIIEVGDIVEYTGEAFNDLIGVHGKVLRIHDEKACIIEFVIRNLTQSPTVQLKNVKLISKSNKSNTKQNEVQRKITAEAGRQGSTAIRREKRANQVAIAGRLVGNSAKGKVSTTRVGRAQKHVPITGAGNR